MIRRVFATRPAEWLSLRIQLDANPGSQLSVYLRRVVLGVCTAAATPTSTSISLTGTNVDLTWADNSANAGGYEVHRSTSPCFTVDFDSLHETLAAGVTSTTDTGAAGSTSENYFYIVRGFSNCGMPSGFEKRLGEFDFELVPGNE